MYAWPITFPAQTNREDMLRTLSLFDDDTGQPIDISGRTLAAAGDFTGSEWTATCGNIITNSVTELTIKDYPFGDEMQAITLTVDLNLGILAQDFLTIADPTGLNTMTGYVTNYTPSTGALIVQVGSAFEFEIRGHHGFDGGGSGYSESSSDIGTDNLEPIISAQLGNGITAIGLGVMQLRIPVSTINKLHHRTYSAAMSMFDGADTRQLFVGKQPIIGGAVRTMPLPTTQPSNPYGLP